LSSFKEIGEKEKTLMAVCLCWMKMRERRLVADHSLVFVKGYLTILWVNNASRTDNFHEKEKPIAFVSKKMQTNSSILLFILFPH